MGFTITCPYCFKTMKDTEVHFRSEKINSGENNIIPDEYDDIDDFLNRYKGEDKEELLAKYQDWDFFAAKTDEIYNQFWNKYNGTTEADPADEYLETRAYLRPIINPSDKEHQRYLKRQQDGSYYCKSKLSDESEWASHIELASEEICRRRVCCHCHNPLPDHYGKNPVKFVTVIGITGAGKTVYLSQLLRGMPEYCAKVGMTAIANNASINNFLEDNRIAADEPLPGSTPISRFQQPLFYEMISETEDGKRETKTLVLYDVAGEVFKSQSLVEKFAPFIEHADGIIVLIDPMQFKVVSGVSKDGKMLDYPVTVMTAIHNLMSNGDESIKCETPFAVCISKADTKEVQNVFNDKVKDLLLNDVQGIQDKERGYYLPQFNAVQYTALEKELFLFIQKNEPTLATLMRNSYVWYDYFAFTALGCEVADKELENGSEYQCPVGPVIPKRIEEPLLWILYKLGYIGKNADLPNEICCPNCGSINHSYKLMDDECFLEIKSGFFGLKKEKKEVNRCCKDCGYKWYYRGNVENKNE